MAPIPSQRPAYRVGLFLVLLAALMQGACSPLGVGISATTATGVVIAQERSAGDAVDDAGINLQISEALFQAHIDDLYRKVNVDVMEARVLLTGQVKTQQLVDQAALIAWKVDGVATVINEVRVGELDALEIVRDRWISMRLRVRMLGDTEIYDVNYTIVTVGGSIYLLGIGQSQDELEQVLAHARDMPYVRRVVAHVVMKDDPSRSAAATE
ncbi:MAG: BON domain-containing protein [Alphaproteobacteria bacterium]|jgi:osmotically-inducible protein OsmY|nr:BON domain-containing protein [Alphaproteobacteria bacterium]MDP6238443.1 BON domain-containing protein [Alphaproteobacteria bacterium]MDP7172599.1 BON domain-containing protein [Alphaproteobacteria bacterium]MDP7234270.1 BON domain-containing protein [Alphaproteobacteria bacterium]HJN20892.1 BON domain-containing protein [Alphaproteobacteria bacterium]|tara:strand:- start:1113 stop:1748 length:636 start_codon:yes stop_codon:yes gene_type:complete